MVTTQAVEPKTPIAGQPLAFAVVAENNAVARRVVVKELLPSEVSMVSAKLSQGACHTRRDGVGGRESVGCDLGVTQRGHGRGRNRRNSGGCRVYNEHGGCRSEVLPCNPGEFFLGDRKGEAGTSIGNLAASRE